MKTFKGIPASSGVVSGFCYVIADQILTIPEYHIGQEEKESGWNRFSQCRQQVLDSMIQTASEADPDQAPIFETYVMMLSDPEFVDEIKKVYEKDSLNIETVVKRKTREYADRLKSAGIEYLAERSQDILDVYGKVLEKMCPPEMTVREKLESVPEKSVLVCDTLKPSDAVYLGKKKVSGLVTKEGGTSSHVAIIARSLGIPYVTGAEVSEEDFPSGGKVIVDGSEGIVIVEPDSETEKFYDYKIQGQNAESARLEKFSQIPGMTVDGTRIDFLANAGSVEEAEKAFSAGADGIGLFRTEFLFMDNADMGEEAQYEAYRRVLEAAHGKPVTIRTLDVGGDKIVANGSVPMQPEKETNPLLGQRAIRFCLANPDFFRTQLRALLRASVHGNLKIMLPLVTGPDQLESAAAILGEEAEKLEKAGIPFNKNVPLGVMIETPAAAVLADWFAKKADFFSLGTNDLTQYTLCVDRENGSVAGLFNQMNPAVCRLIAQTASAAKEAGIPVSVCGSLAGTEEGSCFLTGLGITKLSMPSGQINRIKSEISGRTLEELSQFSQNVLSCGTMEQTSSEINNFFKREN
ncbi:MAG: phosphoenolpyruvate--protein phosphotransferase [Treponemataceae bacterium]|nr:phosphoenolpyruvate--protein phosphotransferase [Treponemataceae bacterium]